MAKNKQNKAAQNNQYNAEFAEEFNQNNAAAGKAANANAAQQKAEK
ncbi:hypothetical protein [Paenibacillus arenilitoris]|uniref:Uncharacterized protein n=1 Tax=Paenibacillus arenilitoris TaxID=2772299 RepID=A0A927CTU0_9BACL|nr:hypothetical protein [Paenibacillus arenilitoris]MBD2872121.1 hypothetical protein [Paenibacillus arenilitoris]